MPTLVTRAGKGSELSHTEMDANLKRTVTQKTTTYSCLVGDNRSTIEGLHATTAFTITLGDAATMAAADTGDYEVTIVNIGAAIVTVARAGTDTINGAATSLALAQYASVTLKVISAGTGYVSVGSGSELRPKVIDIGDWDMSSATGTSFVNVAHGLTYSKIRAGAVSIRADNDIQTYDISTGGDGSTFRWGATDVVLYRATGGFFDGGTTNDTSYNRGWITIWHID